MKKAVVEFVAPYLVCQKIKVENGKPYKEL